MSFSFNGNTPKSIIFNNQEVKKLIYNNDVVWEKKRLPDEYQEVEYIESTGTQWIDTGISPNILLKGEITIMPKRYGYPIGSTNGQNKDYWGINFHSSNKFECYLGSGTYPKESNWSLDTKYNIVINDNKKFYANNTLLTDFSNIQNNYNFNTNKNIYLFRMNYSNLTVGYFRFYNAKFWNNGEVVRDFVPCYRKSDNEIGMYDVVNNVFYTNAGTGTFTKGPDVN